MQRGTMDTSKIVGHATAIALLLASACAGDVMSTPSTEQSALNSQLSSMAQGLTVLQKTAQQSARFVYKRGERAVTIETRRGPDTPAEYLDLDDPPPPFATEVYVLDRAGSPIYVRAEAADDALSSPADLLLHAEDLALAPEALRAAADELAASGSSFSTEQRALTESAAALADGGPPADADKAIVSAELVTADVSAAPDRLKHAVALYQAPLKKAGVRIGWHSATRVAYYVGTTWTAKHDECNHGRCPGADGMSEVCHWVSAPRTTARRTAHCSTTEDWKSHNTHNCNDDSHLQVITLRYDRPYSPADGSCHDTGVNPGPDGCDPSTSGWSVD
jgi:hypothetical protein